MASSFCFLIFGFIFWGPKASIGLTAIVGLSIAFSLIPLSDWIEDVQSPNRRKDNPNA